MRAAQTQESPRTLRVSPYAETQFRLGRCEGGTLTAEEFAAAIEALIREVKAKGPSNKTLLVEMEDIVSLLREGLLKAPSAACPTIPVQLRPAFGASCRRPSRSSKPSRYAPPTAATMHKRMVTRRMARLDRHQGRCDSIMCFPHN